MSKKDISKHIDNLSEDAKAYIKSEIAYYKLDLYKKTIKSISYSLRFLLSVSILILLFVFLSISIGLVLGELFGHYFIGFLIVTGLYAIVFFISLKYGKKFIEGKILRLFNHIFEDV